jgi:hypothetical protein
MVVVCSASIGLPARVASPGNVTEGKCASSLAVFSIKANHPRREKRAFHHQSIDLLDVMYNLLTVVARAKPSPSPHMVDQL